MSEQLDRAKLKEVVCWVVNSVGPEALGQTKLHKVLYYAEMLTFLATGRPLTGAIFRKRPYGPTCDALLGIQDELSKEGCLEVTRQNYYGYKKTTFALLGRFSPTLISADEISLLRDVVEFVCLRNSAVTISEFSHDIVWQMVEFGEDIPYHSALNLVPNEETEDALSWGMSVAKEIEDARPIRAADLEGRPPRAL